MTAFLSIPLTPTCRHWRRSYDAGVQHVWSALRRERGAILAVVLLASIIVAVIVVRQSGAMVEEKGLVLSFSSRPDTDGDHPIVSVRLQDGRVEQVRTTPMLLERCARGKNIVLVRRSHSLQVGPEGCGF
jgi:hypothetical protein